VKTDCFGKIADCLTKALHCPGCVSEHLHKATLSPLTPGELYNYQVSGSDKAYTFRAKKNLGATTLAIFGDMGTSIPTPEGPAPSLARLISEAEAGTIDGVLHVGDFGYDLWDEGGSIAQTFMRQIEPIAARVPYMGCPGNHEGGTNFAGSLHHYVKRFNFPNKAKSSNNYYSFDLGPAHVISLSSEAYFWQIWEVEKQYAWLKEDLKRVDRSKTPFIITMSHRPFYCSNGNHDDCAHIDSNMRTGLPVSGMRFFKLEELFRE